ncbi:hypothetical protein ACFO3K_12960 [Cellulomonas algicola]|uniref:hypothetical protein n=1 Tax=Cellulomonas algicola TaxID=2071633 RepID=UPI001C3F9C32|nr:hypothetical protein [Cellulomonas algicola]
MTGRVMFDGRAQVHYRQLLVETGDGSAVYDAAFAGQTNGLVGAAVPGCAVLITGTHTGDVGLRVVLHDAAPPFDPQWGDVVEAPFTPAGPEVVVHGLMSDAVCTFALPAGSYRLRWSGAGMDEAYDGTVFADDPLVDTFELALWPAASRPAEVVRQESRRGREAHRAHPLVSGPDRGARLEG